MRKKNTLASSRLFKMQCPFYALRCLLTLSFILLAACSSLCLASEKEHRLQISMKDTFVVTDSPNMAVEIQKLEPMKFADVKVTPQKGSAYTLMLYFKADTPDLAQFDTPEKIKNSVISSSGQYLTGTVEHNVALNELKLSNGYGYYTMLTYAKLARLAKVPPGEFKYISRGMIRVSADSVLGFSLMTNDRGKLHRELLNYIVSFTKGK